jgi:hypothetical protein
LSMMAIGIVVGDGDAGSSATNFVRICKCVQASGEGVALGLGQHDLAAIC